MKIIETLWFNSFGGTVGIVVGEEDTTKDRKAYIGSASGLDEKADTDHIVNFGLPFSFATAERIVRLLQKDKPFGGGK